MSDEERVANIKKYYSSMKSLDPDIQGDIRFLIDRVDSMMGARGIVEEIYGHYVLEADRYRKALENIKIYLETSNVPDNDKPLMMTDVLMIVNRGLGIKL